MLKLRKLSLTFSKVPMMKIFFKILKTSRFWVSNGPLFKIWNPDSKGVGIIRFWTCPNFHLRKLTVYPVKFKMFYWFPNPWSWPRKRLKNKAIFWDKLAFPRKTSQFVTPYLFWQAETLRRFSKFTVTQLFIK